MKTLMDYCISTNEVCSMLRERHTSMATKHFMSYDESAGSVSIPKDMYDALETAEEPTKSLKCRLTRIKGKTVSESLRFVVIPKEYHSFPPIVDQENDDNSVGPMETGEDSKVAGSSDGQGQVVAIENAMVRLMAARDLARREQIKFQDHLATQIEFIVKGTAPPVYDYEKEKPQPILGHTTKKKITTSEITTRCMERMKSDRGNGIKQSRNGTQDLEKLRF